MAESKKPPRIRVNESIDDRGLEYISVALIGNVDSGKSSTVGTLISDLRDDGNGSARKFVFVHQHEKESGRTSDISQRYIKKENRIVTFIDLAGHEKYLKTTLNGLTACHPDFAIVCISDKITAMTKEHMGLCIALNIPFVINFTKIDMITQRLTAELIANCKSILLKNGKVLIETPDEAMIEKYIHNQHKKIVPFIRTSNKSGEGLNLINRYILKMPRRPRLNPSGFLTEHVYNVTGFGTVLSGFSGIDISIGDVLYMGPFENGSFIQVSIKSIHNNSRFNIEKLPANSTGCLAIGLKAKDQKFVPRKGTILCKESPKSLCVAFEAQVQILHHTTTIKPNYTTYINCGALREAVRFIGLFNAKGESLDCARSGDNIIIRMTFLKKNLNYLDIGQELVFRENHTKGVGYVTKLILNNVSRETYSDETIEKNKQ